LNQHLYAFYIYMPDVSRGFEQYLLTIVSQSR
jgi:hypothetical protein